MTREEKMREYRKAYKLRYPERIKEAKERWRKKNMDVYAKWARQSRLRNLEKVKERERQYYIKNPQAMAKKNAARKARYYSVRREYYDRLDIYERDKGVCCICLELIDLTKPSRHPESFTIQHHIPLSQGGADAPDNLGIAHYSCNSSVGNRRVTNV